MYCSHGFWWVPGPAAAVTGRSPLLTLGLLEPPREVIDAHVLELEQVLQAPDLHLQDLSHGAPRLCLASATLSALPLQPNFLGSPHLHSLLRSQQLLFFFRNLENEAGVALQCLAIAWRFGGWVSSPPEVEKSLVES